MWRPGGAPGNPPNPWSFEEIDTAKWLFLETAMLATRQNGHPVTKFSSPSYLKVPLFEGWSRMVPRHLLPFGSGAGVRIGAGVIAAEIVALVVTPIVFVGCGQLDRRA